MEEELLNDEKEVSEHLMLIDLGRNDIGKVCSPGKCSCKRDDGRREICSRNAYSLKCAQPKENLRAIDLLRATLPVGTLSGAPKVRAMQIIDELEPERGVFGGAVGYLRNGNRTQLSR